MANNLFVRWGNFWIGVISIIIVVYLIVRSLTDNWGWLITLSLLVLLIGSAYIFYQAFSERKI